jgi:hypothetical protein
MEGSELIYQSGMKRLGSGGIELAASSLIYQSGIIA